MIKNKKILTASVAAMAFWAMASQAMASAAVAAIDERLKPVGEVCLQGQPCAGSSSSAAGGARSGQEVVTKYCNTCHSIGLLNAPKVGDTAAWAPRAEAKGGLDGLLKSAISGINAMPPKGTCADCSDDELKAAIKQMSGL